MIADRFLAASNLIAEVELAGNRDGASAGTRSALTSWFGSAVG